MTQKLYAELRQVILIDEEIDELGDKIQALEYCLMPGGIDYSKDKVQTSPEDSMSRVVAEIFDLQDKRKRLQEERVAAVDHLNEVIDSVNGYRSRRVLRLRYLNKHSFEDISSIMVCSLDNVYRLHRLATKYLDSKKS